MNATGQRGRVEVSRPRFLREVPGFLNALRIALTVCRETPRAELLATANALLFGVAAGLAFVGFIIQTS